MKLFNFPQGSPEWHAHRATHFNASDAPAMMGVSPHCTRTELLQRYHFGQTEEINQFTQRRYDEGHDFEALARPLAEAIIGQDLYPVVGADGNKLSASFDGLTMDEMVNWEHKRLNNDLRAIMIDGCTGADLPAMYRIQMAQQMMVSGCQRVLFMASLWESGALVEERHCWYEFDLPLTLQISAGWKQFEIDLANYRHVEAPPQVVAEPTMSLPSVFVNVSGALAVKSNLPDFGQQLRDFIDGLDLKPSTDQAFANSEAAIKTLKQAEEALEQAEFAALAQTESVDDLRRTIKMFTDLARNTRLMLDKMVTARKKEIRTEIQTEFAQMLKDHVTELNAWIGNPYMPTIAADFAGVMKAKKSVATLREACNNELVRCKIEAGLIAERIVANLTHLRNNAAEYTALFADTAQIVLKQPDDLTALVKARIADHLAEQERKRKAIEASPHTEQAPPVEVIASVRAATPGFVSAAGRTGAQVMAEAARNRIATKLQRLTLAQLEWVESCIDEERWKAAA
jgi:putative phage-type endonuclease